MSAVFWFRMGAALACLGVAFGAFGAHGLRGRLGDQLDSERVSDAPKSGVAAVRRLEVFETGVRYHLVHGLGVFVAAWLAGEDQSRTARLAGLLPIVGILLFSGSLYVLALTGIRAFGAITPLGGVAWLAAWVLIATRVGLARQ